MDVVFFGTPEFAVSSLNALIENDDINVLAVVSQPDKPQGRKRILMPTPVKQVAIDNNIPVFQPNTRRELFQMVKDFECDFFIVVAFGMILRQKVLDIPKVATLNVHGSVLPQYRGPSPIHYSLLNGDAEAGVSIMALDAEMDHGPVYATAVDDVTLDDNFSSLYERLSSIGADLLVDVLPEILSGDLEATKQDHDAATYCKMIKKEDGFVNFADDSASKVLNMMRAYEQWPFVFVEFLDQKLKLVSAKNVEDAALFEDLAKDVSTGDFFVFDKNLFLKFKNSFLQILKVQLPGKNIIDHKSFLNGAGRDIAQLKSQE